MKGSTVYSDALRSYRNVDVDGYEHEFVDHTVEYVRGRVHTNGMENVWSLVKRALKGTYVSVEPFHLQAYCDEQAFSYNHRKGNDADRFTTVMKQVVGKRITYNELVGKTEEAAQSWGPCRKPFASGKDAASVEWTRVFSSVSSLTLCDSL